MHTHVHGSTVHKTKLWKYCTCPSDDEWVENMWYLYTKENSSGIHKDKLEFVDKWRT